MSPKGDSMANPVRLRALTRGERRVLRAKVRDRRLSVRLHRRYRVIAEVADGHFEADVMRQTLELTTLGALAQGDGVNLELALRASDRLGGHVVQGHVDATATVASVTDEGIARRLRVALPSDLMPYVVERGSVAIDGVSLTIAALGPETFEIALVPHTLDATTLGALDPGDEVNLEVDVIAKYVERLMQARA